MHVLDFMTTQTVRLDLEQRDAERDRDADCNIGVQPSGATDVDQVH